MTVTAWTVASPTGEQPKQKQQEPTTGVDTRTRTDGKNRHQNSP